jgi:hypothetical protein
LTNIGSNEQEQCIHRRMSSISSMKKVHVLKGHEDSV